MAANGRVWSPYQLAIFEDFKRGQGHTVIEAVAGSGKTTTILEGIKHVPQGTRVLFMAFNRETARTLADRVPSGVVAKTTHGVGYGAVQYAWRGRVGSVDLDDKGPTREHKLANELVPRWSDEDVGILLKLVAFCKAWVVTSEAKVRGCADYYDLRPARVSLDELVQVAVKILLASLEPSALISYDDMVFVPTALGLKPRQYDMVVVDECFLGDTPVQLADGSSKTIGEIVDNKLDVEVLSYDEATGSQVAKRVVGVKKVPISKPLVRVVVQQTAYKQGRACNLAVSRNMLGRRMVVCTEDHQFYADGRWVAAKDLAAGDKVQVESGAPRDTSYNHRHKIGIKGKQSLRDCITPRQSSLPRVVGNPAGPHKRGGNGKGLTEPQKFLLGKLGEGWIAEHVVLTGEWRARHVAPNCYKLDLAHVGCKIGIEIDGASHNTIARREADRRKDAFFASIGWTLVRVSNRDAVVRADEIVASLPKACPVDGTVVSVDPYESNESFVYDLSVEDTHCYYAHGILVHNCQDLNRGQVMLAKMSLARGGRLIAVGDSSQAIYAFRAADSESMDRLVKSFSAKRLALSVTYRCPRLVVDQVKPLVPHIEAAPGAKPGVVQPATGAEMIDGWRPGDFVISRVNAPLVALCVKAWRRDIPAAVLGKDVGKAVRELVDRYAGESVTGLVAFVTDWREREERRLLAAKKEDRIASVIDRAETVVALCEGVVDMVALRTRIATLFAEAQTEGRKGVDLRSNLIFASTHKAKGLEAERVWVLEKTYRPQAGDEESNLMYVACTRSLDTLRLVQWDPKTEALK